MTKIRFLKSDEPMKTGDILFKRPGRRAKFARYIMRFGLRRFLYRFGYYTTPVGVFMGPRHDEDIAEVLSKGRFTINRPPGWFD